MEPAIHTSGVPLINEDGTPAICKPEGCCVDEECDLVADFTFTKTAGPCVFNFTAIANSRYPITSYVWSFGDGQSGTGQTVNHSYFTAFDNVFNVTLTVTDDHGCQVRVDKVLACSVVCGCIEAVTTATVEVGAVDGGFCEAACNAIAATYIVSLTSFLDKICSGTVSTALALCDNVCTTGTEDRVVNFSVIVTITKNETADTLTLGVVLNTTVPTSDEDLCKSGYANYETIIGKPGSQCKGTFSNIPLVAESNSICRSMPSSIDVVLA